jgi:poly-gamma-glutamate system protein
LAVAAVGSLLLVEHFPLVRQKSHVEEKRAAALLAERAMATIRQERPRRGLAPFESTDLAHTGLIGPTSTPITTSTGSLSAKRTAANPNFAAALVEMCMDLGLERGDLVAIGYSGSFPGLNIATLAAVDSLGLEPLIISSAASSDYGASAPQLSWLDMEGLLHERGVFRGHSLGASLGGIEDQGIGLGPSGVTILASAIERSGAEPISASDFDSSLAERMALYDRVAASRPIRAYINVGGGAVSVGRSRGKMIYVPGINRPGPKAPVDSIIGRFLDRGVPVIHLTHVAELARKYHLPEDPHEPQRAGQGEIFEHKRPNRWLALGVLLVLGFACWRAGRRARERAHGVAAGGPSEPTEQDTPAGEAPPPPV